MSGWSINDKDSYKYHKTIYARTDCGKNKSQHQNINHKPQHCSVGEPKHIK